MVKLIAFLFLLILSDKVRTQEISTSVQTVTNHTHIERILHEIDTGHDEHDDDDDHHDHHDDVVVSNHAEDYKTWVFASLAVLGISLCGVFGVIIIPIMQKIFYQHLLQFLIALGW